MANIMGRLIVLCLVFLCLLSFPGHACALGDSGVTGYLWLDKYDYAYNPSLVLTHPLDTKTATAAFTVSDINFDSNRSGNSPILNFGDFLGKYNTLTWTKGDLSGTQMFSSISTESPTEGIFFFFIWSMDVIGSPVIISHDDGFVLAVPTRGFSTGDTYSSPVQTTQDTPPIDLGLPPGNFTFNLSYGVLNDSANHALIFRTPEPGSMLLLGLGLVGIGFVMRKML
jgi:hypothetical protein